MRLAFVGDHQTRALHAASMLMLDNAEIRLLESSATNPPEQKRLHQFFDDARHCDHLLVQTAALNSDLAGPLGAMVKDKPIQITSLRCSFLFPDTCRVDTATGPVDKPMAFNSVAVVDAFHRGISGEQAVNSFHLENLNRLQLLRSWREETEEEQLRERVDLIDVPGSALVEEACSRYQAFLAPNTPALPLVVDYLALVFRQIGVRFKTVDACETADPMHELEGVPILDEVAAYHRLPYRTPQLWKPKGLLAHPLTRDAYVAAFFKAYATSGLESMRVRSPDDAVAGDRRIYRVSRWVGWGNRQASVNEHKPILQQSSSADEIRQHVSELETMVHAVSQLQVTAQAIQRSHEALADKIRCLDQQISIAQHRPALLRRAVRLLRRGRALVISAAIIVLGASASTKIKRLP